MTRFAEQTAARWVPLCFLVACQGEPTTPSAAFTPGGVTAMATDNTVTSLTIVPDSQMVFLGDRFSFIARPKNKAGQILDRAVQWSVTNTKVAVALGTTEATMSFQALKTGATSIKAQVDAKSRFSKVVVRATAGGKVVVTPAEATVPAAGTVQFSVAGLTAAGEPAQVNVTWTTTGGLISTTGLLAAPNAAGTYLVIARSAFGAADTSRVTVGAPPEPIAALFLVPATADLPAGGTLQFAAYGRTAAGDSVGAAVSYSATGGTIAAGGLYTAGGTGGNYQVVATSGSLSATAQVTIAPPGLGRLVLVPDLLASRPGQATKFAATVFNSVGDTVPSAVDYRTTCGAVSGTGVYTAPTGQTGSCLVIASAGAVADTTQVALLVDTPGIGIPFGLHDLWSSPTVTRSTGTGPLTASQEYMSPANLPSHIAAARAQGIRLVLSLTGGTHGRYKTDGVFDLTKWQVAMDAFNKPAIQAAVAQGVADGTIIGNTVMDEPQQFGTDEKAWGPPGTMTKARIDGLCTYVKGIFPTLPVGVTHDHNAFEPTNSYQVCEFFFAQYALRKGSVTAWRDGAAGLAARDGIKVILSLNVLDGGQQDKSGAWDCPGTGGLGTRSPTCRMTPAQIRDWGKLIGPAGCALLMWRYDAAFLARPENQAALSDVALTLSTLPRTGCSR